VNDRPDAVELLRSVERFLETQVVPALEGPGRFHARVAANVVAIVAREIETEEEHLQGEWERLEAMLGTVGPAPPGRGALRQALLDRNQELVRRIRSGHADEGPLREQVLAHLRHTVSDKLSVSRPPRHRK
jgi:hypothetical protein